MRVSRLSGLVFFGIALLFLWYMMTRDAGPSTSGQHDPSSLQSGSNPAQTTSLTEPRSNPLDNRQPVAADRTSLLHGLVLSSKGRSLPSVRIIWLALQQEDIEPNPAWPLPGWGVPERKIIEAVTDENGFFALDAPPEPKMQFGSVLIALHPGHFPGGIDLGVARETWPPRVEIVLEPSTAISVKVVDTSNNPQSGASVHHQGKALLSVMDAVESRIWTRFLAEEAVTDTNGRAELAPFHGEQALWADKAELVSIPWQVLRRTLDEVVCVVLIEALPTSLPVEA